MEVALWAFLTGGITGGVGVAIALISRHRRRTEDLEEIIEELEDRAETAERMLADRQGGALPPP
jgi:hypothetical protein